MCPDTAPGSEDSIINSIFKDPFSQGVGVPGNKRKKLCNYLESHRCCGEKTEKSLEDWKKGQFATLNMRAGKVLLSR